MKYYYGDEGTSLFLQGSKKRVYLYGGYVGYNNFGDIIQLKNTIWFHRQSTDYEPVLILHLSSIESKDQVNKIKKWFEVENIVFIADHPYEPDGTGLLNLVTATKGGILHIYGGGFINKYWGSAITKKIADIIRAFDVDEYLFTGQQIDGSVCNQLREIFNDKKPALIGLRDQASLDLFNREFPEQKNRFSFDDVTEIFTAWRDNGQKLSLKTRAVNRIRTKSILIHLNSSEYAVKNVSKLTQVLRKVYKKYPQNTALIAQAYNDRRANLMDSLQTVVQIEDDFPYTNYRVINIADFALKMQPATNKYPGVNNFLSSVQFAVSSSYHTAMLANFFGIPAYLISINNFYSDKQKALGYEPDLDTFLSDPKINLKSFTDELLRREKWLKELKAVVNEVRSRKVKESIDLPNINDSTSVPFKYRSRES